MKRFGSTAAMALALASHPGAARTGPDPARHEEVRHKTKMTEGAAKSQGGVRGFDPVPDRPGPGQAPRPRQRHARRQVRLEAGRRACARWARSSTTWRAPTTSSRPSGERSRCPPASIPDLREGDERRQGEDDRHPEQVVRHVRAADPGGLRGGPEPADQASSATTPPCATP